MQVAYRREWEPAKLRLDHSGRVSWKRHDLQNLIKPNAVERDLRTAAAVMRDVGLGPARAVPRPPSGLKNTVQCTDICVASRYPTSRH